MKKVINKIFSIAIICIFISPVVAEEITLETARKNISKTLGSVNPENIIRSPIPGLYQVAIPPRFYYMSADGRYLMTGGLIDTVTKQDISKPARNKSVAAAINALGEDSMVIFGDSSLKHTITVFTDIDCGYCRKLHNEISKYNKLGIRVRYLAYPRAGIGSDAFKKAEAVWCSKDRKKAMTQAKNGVEIKSKKCANPVKQHHALGNLVGVRGTPALILESGEIVPGYIPAARLSQALNKIKK